MLSLFKAFLTLLLSFLLIVFISLFGNIPLEVFLKLGVSFIVSAAIGAVVLKQLPFIDKFSAISFTLLSSFLGLFILSFLLFVDKSWGLLIIATLFGASIGYLWVHRGKITFNYSIYEALAVLIAIACSLFFAFGDTYAFATSSQLPILAVPSDDIYFFTNLIHTLSKGTIYSATYEIGTPLNYQFIGYFPAAFLAKYAEVPSHLSLYAYLFGLVRLLPFILIIEWVKSYSFTSAYSKWYVLLAPALFTLLQPLHPLYLLKLNPSNFIWSGLGYIGPSLNIGYSFSFVIVLICLLLLQSFDRSKSFLAAGFFIVFLTLLAGIKAPVFYAFGCFVFSLSLFNAFYKQDYYLLKCIIIATPLTLLLMYSLYFGEKTGGALTLNYSYFPDYFNSLFHFSGSLVHLKIIVGVVLLFLVWGSIRFFFMLYRIHQAPSHLRFLYFAAFVSLFLCIVIAAFFDLKIIDDQGQIIRDVSYDSLQFIRSSFFILNAVAVIAALYFLDSLSGKKLYLSFTIVGLWMSLSLIGLISNLYITSQQKSAWLEESYQELQTHKTNGLLAIQPALYNNSYSIWLTARNPGVFWTSNGGCLTTTKNYYRHQLYDSLTIQQEPSVPARIKKEGVAFFIATPDDKSYFVALEKKGLLQSVKDTKWLFTFTDKNPVH